MPYDTHIGQTRSSFDDVDTSRKTDEADPWYVSSARSIHISGITFTWWDLYCTALFAQVAGRVRYHSVDTDLAQHQPSEMASIRSRLSQWQI